MSVITRRGDDGQTDLMFGRRSSKNSLRLHAFGSVDELHAALGLARALGLGEHAEALVDKVQDVLVVLMGELATLPEDAAAHAGRHAQVSADDVAMLEREAYALEARGVRFEGFVKPGENTTPGGAQLDVSRAVCRRAERCALALHEQEPLANVSVLLFLNRLSDLLWLAARAESQQDHEL